MGRILSQLERRGSIREKRGEANIDEKNQSVLVHPRGFTIKIRFILKKDEKVNLLRVKS